ncbi:immunoglobulin domain-containing protein, partial [Capnocytophaga leadbetteri]
MLSRIYKQLQTLLVLFTLTQTTYSYAYTVAGKCESAIRHITISRVATPTVTQTAHTLCGGGSQTIASLQPQDANIVWYNSATGGSPLASTTPLVAGTTYYVAQRNGTYESDKIAVTVTQRASGNETLNFQATNNSLNCIPTGQLRFQIQSPVAGKTYVVELVEMPATYTGTRTFTITETDKDKTISFVKFTGYNMPAGNYKAKLHTYNIANGQPVPATIALMQRDFPAPNRSNNDFGSDQVYQDIQRGGQTSCDYLDIRYGYNTNSPFYKYFNTPELLALYEYTAYSDDDLANKYGGNPNDTRIVWRDLFTLPEGTSSVVGKKIIYYDLAAHNRTYKDLKEDPKRPKFYFRIKGQNCNNNSDPMLAGDMRFMNASIVYGGSCKAPEMSVTNENPMVCYPITYVIKHNGVKVGEGQINSARERKKITTLDNGQPFKADQEYEVTFTSVDGQTVTKKETYNTFYNTVRPGGSYTQETRCFGSNEVPKGRIDIYFRQKQWGSILSMNGFKVTLLEAPAGYVEEPGKLKLNETVTIKYQNPSKVITNIMATHNQDDLTQNFSLPEGTYKIKVEDLCGKVTYVYSGRDDSKEEFNLVYPSYQEKPLTPKTETDCAKVRVYPFRGNPTFDWLKAENKNRSVYVYLYKRPDGIAEEDVTVSSNLAQVIASKRYIKAVYNPNDASSANQYFSLPRNQNSEGSYTFVYGGKIDATNSNEQDISTYISSNGTNGCVRTFTISIDDVLLNFDRNGYIGYKCEDNTGKIVVKAINGIGGSGNYQYDLYNVKNGTLIESKTAAKGTAVTFTNLGTFTGGQNSRWVKITDSECPTDPVWKELPITPLNNPQLALATPLQTAYCKGETVTITLHSLGATAYQWKYPNGTTVTTSAPQLVIPSIDAQHAGSYRVVAQGLVCAASTVTFSYTVNILEAPAMGKTYTLCAAATITDLKAKIATDTATVRVYKNGTLVTDNTEALSTTDTYKVSRFNAVCETDKVVVTIVFSNTVTLTVPTALTVTCTATNINTVVSNWLNQATVTDTCGTATLTHNFTAVKPTNWCGAGVVTVTFVARDPQGNTVTKTSLIKVGSTPLVATPDTDFTFPSGSVTDTSTRTVIDNDRIGNRTPTTSDVVITTGTTTTDVVGQTNTPTIDTTTGKVTVPSGTKSGTYTLTYTICERLNPDNCKTTTVTVKVGSTPLVATPDTDFTFPSGSVTDTSTRTVIDNDRIGNRTPTTSDVVITTGTTTTDVVGQTNTPTIDTTTGKVTVPSGTKSGTYTLTYTICERLNPDNCKTTTVTVKVGSTPLVATPDTDFTFPSGSVTDTSTRTVIDNDRIGNRTPTTSDVVITTGTTTTDVVGQTNTPTIDTTTGKVTVPSGTKSGTYTLTYTICERLNPDNCKTTTVTVKVGSTTTPTTIEANDDVATVSSTTGGTTSSVLTNDKLNGVPNPSISSVTLTWTTATPTGFTLNPNGTITIAPNTPAGTYTISYKICAVASSTVCDTADIVVTVTGTTTSTTTPTTIEANDDVATVSSTTGGTTSSVLTNDKLNGVPNPSISSVTLTWTTATPTGFTLNPNGTITVAPNTPAGTYTISYKICAVASPTVCDTADIVVTVTGTTTSTTTPTTIEANDDVATVSSTTGGTTSSVLTNDKLNGVLNPSISSVTLTWTTATPTG